jgi:hypothetical protein
MLVNVSVDMEGSMMFLYSWSVSHICQQIRFCRLFTFMHCSALSSIQSAFLVFSWLVSACMTSTLLS